MDNRYGSFVVDHTKLEPGIYVSRVDPVGEGLIYTIDIRVTKPYKDPTLTHMEMHSVEHIIATQLEKFCTAKVRKVYFGPMGCATGFYALFYVPKGFNAVGSILNYLHLAFDVAVDEVPFNSKQECGNCRTLASDKDDIEKINNLLGDIDEMVNECRRRNSFDEYPYL